VRRIIRENIARMRDARGTYNVLLGNPTEERIFGVWTANNIKSHKQLAYVM
jgi:hypothetical protein